MITIFLSIMCSTGILILFKLLPTLRADTSHSILISYAVSALLGFVVLPVNLAQIQPIWVLTAAIEGIAFYCVFHIMAKSAAHSGVAFTSVAAKMSVIIPITIGLVFLGDRSNLFVIAGILTGLMAVLLSVGDRINTKNWHWPILVFAGSGVIDATFKLFQVWGLEESQFPRFIITIFAFAFIAGLTVFVRRRMFRIAGASLLAGIGLGILNLGTVYFLMSALAITMFNSTLVYALNSFGIVLTSMLVAIALFREPLTHRGYVGMAMAFTSILCLFLSQSS